MRRLLFLLLVLSCATGCGPASSTAEPAVAPSRSLAPAAVGSPVLRVYRAPYVGTEPPALALPGQRAVAAGGGSLCGPHYGLKVLQLSNSATFDARALPKYQVVFPAGLADVVVLASPPTGEFVVAQFGQGCGRNSEERTGLSFAVKVGDKTVTLGADLRNYDVLVVAAPTAAPVALAVTDNGRTATMDLRTGATTGVVPGFDPPRSDWQVLAGKDSAGNLIGGGIECTVVPYAEDKGWAPPGRAWLLVSGKVELAFNGGTEIPIKAEQALTVTGPGGKKIPVTGDLTVGGAHDQQVETDAVAVDVPATGKVTVRYSFKPSGIGWSGQSGGNLTI